MARSQIPFIVQTLAGDVVNGATVQVNVRGAGLASVFVAEDPTNLTTMANPVSTNSLGAIPGWLDEGSYTITVSGPNLTSFTKTVEIVRGDFTIPESKLQSLSVSRGKIQNSAINGDKIEDGAVVTRHIGGTQVTLAKMANNSVDTAQIIDSAINNAKVSPSAAIAMTKLDLAGKITNNEISGSAAIAISKLDLNNQITDAMIASTTRIAKSKLAPLNIGDSDVTGPIAESKLTLASDAAAGTASRRTLGTGAAQAAAGNDTRIVNAVQQGDTRLTNTRTPTPGTITLREQHTWIVGGEVVLPSGDTDYIPPMFIDLRSASNETISFQRVRCIINSGSQVTFDLRRRTLGGTESTLISGAAATTGVNIYSNGVTLTDGDRIYPVVTGVSGTPRNLTITAAFDRTV